MRIFVDTNIILAFWRLIVDKNATLGSKRLRDLGHQYVSGDKRCLR